jgi:hypothetical protein
VSVRVGVPENETVWGFFIPPTPLAGNNLTVTLFGTNSGSACGNFFSLASSSRGGGVPAGRFGSQVRVAWACPRRS